MMNEDKILDELVLIMASILKQSPHELKNKVAKESLLREELGIDSVESLDFMTSIEKKYQIEVADYQLVKLKTVKDVVDLIREETK